MKLYYRHNDITVLCGNTEDLLRALPERHFSVLVLDPPCTFKPEKAQELMAPFDACLKDSAAVLILGLPDGKILAAPRFGHHAVRDLAGVKEVLAKTEGAILDPYMGTGTTLVAAKQLGRECWGIEIERKWCDVAVARLENRLGAALPERELAAK